MSILREPAPQGLPTFSCAFWSSWLSGFCTHQDPWLSCATFLLYLIWGNDTVESCVYCRQPSEADWLCAWLACTPVTMFSIKQKLTLLWSVMKPIMPAWSPPKTDLLQGKIKYNHAYIHLEWIGHTKLLMHFLAKFHLDIYIYTVTVTVTVRAKTMGHTTFTCTSKVPSGAKCRSDETRLLFDSAIAHD